MELVRHTYSQTKFIRSLINSVIIISISFISYFSVWAANNDFAVLVYFNN